MSIPVKPYLGVWDNFINKTALSCMVAWRGFVLLCLCLDGVIMTKEIKKVKKTIDFYLALKCKILERGGS